MKKMEETEEVDAQKTDDCEKGKLRFDVIQVSGSREEDTVDEEYLGEMTPRNPSTAENTVGYGTHEAVPMTVFYRNESSHDQGKSARKARPTLDQLRKGFEKDGNESERQVSNDIVFPIITKCNCDHPLSETMMFTWAWARCTNGSYVNPGSTKILWTPFRSYC